MYLIVRQTHIFAMSLSLILAIAAEPLLLAIARAWSIEQVERRYRLARGFLQLSDLTRFAGFLAGIALVIMGRWNPLAPWLVATYGLFALMDVLGRVGTRPWQRQLRNMLQPQAGGAGLADVREILADRRAMLARWAIIAILLTIMTLMRTKPSFGF